jgi:hypothetical protein
MALNTATRFGPGEAGAKSGVGGIAKADTRSADGVERADVFLSF